MKYDRLKTFRQETYLMLGKAKDATFELMDSIMTTRSVGGLRGCLKSQNKCDR